MLNSKKYKIHPKKLLRHERQISGLQASIEATLNIREHKQKWTVLGLTIFQNTLTIYNEIKQNNNTSYDKVDVLSHLQDALKAITRGKHSFYKKDKYDYYQSARNHLCDTVTILYLQTHPDAAHCAQQIEERILTSLGGLLGRVPKFEGVDSAGTWLCERSATEGCYWW